MSLVSEAIVDFSSVHVGFALTVSILVFVGQVALAFQVRMVSLLGFGGVNVEVLGRMVGFIDSAQCSLIVDCYC